MESLKTTKPLEERVVKLVKESVLSRFLICLTRISIHLVKSKCFWKRFGLLASTDGSWLIATTPLKKSWMSFLRLRVTGRQFKSSTILSTDQTWVMLEDSPLDPSTLTVSVIFTQIELRHSMNLGSLESFKKNLLGLITINFWQRFQTQSEQISNLILTLRWQLMTLRRKICLADILWLSSDNSTTVYSMLSSN